MGFYKDQMRKYLESILHSNWLLLVHIQENGAGRGDDGWGERRDGIRDDVPVSGVLLGELENTGESAGGDFSAGVVCLKCSEAVKSRGW